MQDASVVPHHDITLSPLIFELGIGFLDCGKEFVEDCLPLILRYVSDSDREPRASKQDDLLALRLSIHERMLYRWMFLELLRIKLPCINSVLRDSDTSI